MRPRRATLPVEAAVFRASAAFRMRDRFASRSRVVPEALLSRIEVPKQLWMAGLQDVLLLRGWVTEPPALDSFSCAMLCALTGG